MSSDVEYWLDYFDAVANSDEIAEAEDAHQLQEYEQFARDYERQ